MARKALGKGLMALIDEDIRSDVLPEKKISARTVKDLAGRIMEVPLEKLVPFKNQARKDFSGLQELISSIREKGILQPLLVRKIKTGYEVIAGERRLRAARECRLKTVPVVIMERSEQETMEISLIENVQRKNLNPVEEANGYRVLLERFSLTQEEVARKVGKERSSVTNSLRLLSLPDSVLNDVSRGTVSPGHAKILAGIKNKNKLISLYKKIIRSSLSVRGLEDLVYGQTGKNKKNSKKKQSSKDIYLKDIEEKFENYFSTKVRILGDQKKGKLEIEYYSTEDLERFIEVID